MFKKSIGFLKSVWQELRFVSWPSYVDLKEGTAVIIVMSSIVAIFLSIVDGVFGVAIRMLFKWI